MTFILFWVSFEPQKTHDYLICYNRRYNEEIPKFRGLKYLEDHCFLLCQPRAGGQLCSIKSSRKAGKQGGSVVLDKASQGCLALQTEGKKEGKFIAKDFFLSTGHPSFLLKFQWGELSDSKLPVKVGYPIFLFFNAPEEGKMDWGGGQILKREGWS